VFISFFDPIMNAFVRAVCKPNLLNLLSMADDDYDEQKRYAYIAVIDNSSSHMDPGSSLGDTTFSAMVLPCRNSNFLSTVRARRYFMDTIARSNR
jgi:hypothetical protein